MANRPQILILALIFNMLVCSHTVPGASAQSGSSPTRTSPSLRIVIDDFQYQGDSSRIQAARLLPWVFAAGLAADPLLEGADRRWLTQSGFGSEQFRRQAERGEPTNTLRSEVDFVLSGLVLEYDNKLLISAQLYNTRNSETREITSPVADAGLFLSAAARFYELVRDEVLGSRTESVAVVVGCFQPMGANGTEELRSLSSTLSSSLAARLHLDGTGRRAIAGLSTRCEDMPVTSEMLEQAGAEWGVSGSVSRQDSLIRVTPVIVWRQSSTPLPLPAITRPITSYFDLEEHVLSELGQVLTELSMRPDGWDALLSAATATGTDLLARAATLADSGFIAAAILVARRAIDQEPGSAAAYLQLGRLYAMRGLGTEAVTEFRAALALAPARADIYEALGDALLERHEFASAVQSYQGALERSPRPNSRLMGKLADAQVLSGQTEDAVRNYARAVRHDSTNSALLAKHGEALRLLGRFDEAVLTFERALELDSTTHIARTSLGTLYRDRGIELLNNGRPADALTVFMNAVPYYPESAYVWVTYTLNQLKNFNAVLETADEAISRGHRTSTLYNNRGFALANLNRHTEAVSDFETALELDSTNQSVFTNLAREHWAIRHYRESIRVLELAVQRFPGEFEPRVEWARALRLIGDLARSLEIVNQVGREFPDSTVIRTERGWALQELGRYEEALREYDLAIRADRDNPASYSNRAALFVDLGRYREAVMDADISIRIDSSRPQPYNHKGFALYRLGDLEAGKDLVLRALDLHEAYPAAHYNLARIAVAEGDTALALSHLERAIALSPVHLRRARSEPAFEVIRSTPDFERIAVMVKF